MSQWYDKNFLKGYFFKCHLDHNLWPRIKDQGIESQNAEYYKVVQKPELKLLGVSVDEQLKFTTHASSICRKDASLVGMILKLRKLIPTSANCKLSNLQYCHMSLPIDARCQKVRKASRKSTMCCLLQQKNYYIWLICLLYRIVGYKKRPQICKKQKITYHLPA